MMPFVHHCQIKGFEMHYCDHSPTFIAGQTVEPQQKYGASC